MIRLISATRGLVIRRIVEGNEKITSGAGREQTANPFDLIVVAPEECPE
jgi:hypothetical protein